MTEQDIIDMAEFAGVSVRGHYDETGSTPQELLKFYKVIVAKEREECAMMCVNATKDSGVALIGSAFAEVIRNKE